MKKHFFILFLSALFLSVNAQSSGSTGYWDLEGNSNTNVRANFIGTTDANPLIFKTFGNERMRLLPEKAFLGIGLPTPQATLHLHYQNVPLSPSSQKLLQLTTDATTNGPGNGFSIISNRDTKDIIFRQQESAKFFLEGPGGGLVVAPTGKIGIGTDAPKEKVHIDEGNLLITSANSGATNLPTGALLFENSSKTRWGIEYFNSTDPSIEPVYGGNGLNFRKYGGLSAPNAINSTLFLSDNERIGIGSINPQGKLHVNDGNIFISTPLDNTTGTEQSALVFGIFEGGVMTLPPPSKWGN